NKVEKIGGKFIIRTNDQSSYQIINTKERLDILLEIIKLFDDSVLMVNLEQDSTNVSTQDVKDNLRVAFKDKIKFEE
ncbi:MAG: hypothetical protein MJ152_04000, partial [Clostridia bacterium]|nr:hypothetical protein [Clostridia bacterium]